MPYKIHLFRYIDYWTRTETANIDPGLYRRGTNQVLTQKGSQAETDDLAQYWNLFFLLDKKKKNAHRGLS